MLNLFFVSFYSIFLKLSILFRAELVLINLNFFGYFFLRICCFILIISSLNIFLFNLTLYIFFITLFSFIFCMVPFLMNGVMLD